MVRINNYDFTSSDDIGSKQPLLTGTFERWDEINRRICHPCLQGQQLQHSMNLFLFSFS